MQICFLSLSVCIRVPSVAKFFSSTLLLFAQLIARHHLVVVHVNPAVGERRVGQGAAADFHIAEFTVFLAVVFHKAKDAVVAEDKQLVIPQSDQSGMEVTDRFFPDLLAGLAPMLRSDAAGIGLRTLVMT